MGPDRPVVGRNSTARSSEGLNRAQRVQSTENPACPVSLGQTLPNTATRCHTVPAPASAATRPKWPPSRQHRRAPMVSTSMLNGTCSESSRHVNIYSFCGRIPGTGARKILARKTYTVFKANRRGRQSSAGAGVSGSSERAGPRHSCRARGQSPPGCSLAGAVPAAAAPHRLDSRTNAQPGR
jgi:hypothetical protein